MRSLYFTASERGLTRAQVRWMEAQGRCRRVGRGVYRDGPEPPSALDRALGLVISTGGAASGRLAAVLHGCDGIDTFVEEVTIAPTGGHKRSRTRRRDVELVDVVGFSCTTVLQMLVDLAAEVSDDVWEQALEWALRKKHVALADIEARLPALSASRVPGTTRIRRVLRRRPAGAPPTESLLETLMVQAIRAAGLPDPARQIVVVDRWGNFVARVDLGWPADGLFFELDGQHHKDQPVYDANRETAVVAATGWLAGRFTWDEVADRPRSTGRRVAALLEQARRRALPSTG